jgi:hypothetical protein
MSPKRILRLKRVPKIPRRSKGGAVTRAEFNAVIRLLNQRGEIIDDLRRELRLTCQDLAENVRRELQTQLTRIAQIQQEIDTLKKKNGR